MSVSTTSLPAKPFPVLGHIARDVSRDINLVFYLLTIALTLVAAFPVFEDWSNAFKVFLLTTLAVWGIERRVIATPSDAAPMPLRQGLAEVWAERRARCATMGKGICT